MTLEFRFEENGKTTEWRESPGGRRDEYYRRVLEGGFAERLSLHFDDGSILEYRLVEKALREIDANFLKKA